MGPAASLSDLLSDEGRRDPYRFYARLHERGEAVPLGPADRYAVVVCGYEAVNRILCDPGFQVVEIIPPANAPPYNANCGLKCSSLRS